MIQKVQILMILNVQILMARNVQIVHGINRRNIRGTERRNIHGTKRRNIHGAKRPTTHGAKRPNIQQCKTSTQQRHHITRQHNRIIHIPTPKLRPLSQKQTSQQKPDELYDNGRSAGQSDSLQYRYCTARYHGTMALDTHTYTPPTFRHISSILTRQEFTILTCFFTYHGSFGDRILDLG